MPTPPFPVKRDQEKYTLPSQAPPVRSTSIEVLSLNLPSKFGADDPRATIVVPSHLRPSLVVLGASGPSGLTNRATHTSPKVFRVPAGSSELSEPKNARPWLSHAITGSPELAVRGRCVAIWPYGE